SIRREEAAKSISRYFSSHSHLRLWGGERMPSVVVMHREDSVERFLVRIDVDHPAEDGRAEAAASRVAGLLGGDGPFEAELGPIRVFQLRLRRKTEIGVEMPHCDAEGHALVQLIFCRALRHGVHRAHELIAGSSLFVEQGGWTRRIEFECGQKAIGVIR